MDFKYTLAFIKRGNQILLMNRIKHPWMGHWNGIGGKKEPNESALDCIIREIHEETNILLTKNQIIDKGIVTWNKNFSAKDSGLHLFYVKLADNFDYQTPLNTVEGIIDWKELEWVTDPTNLGVAHNIRYFLSNLLDSSNRYWYHCTFKQNHLKKVVTKLL